MPVQVTRLRRWFAGAAIFAILVVSGTYFYARWRVTNALKQVPEKMGIEIQQSAQGFTVSKSEAGHTLFKIQASKALQYKQGGIAELHDVAITLYGRDRTRFDQIYGAEFDYDPRSGDIVSRGAVDIDLQANPEGAIKPDQAPPKELKNPIHLKTSDLIFNQKTGNAFTKEKVEFRIPQANGSAVGVSYTANTGVLTLQSQVNVVFTGQTPGTLNAARGTISKVPHQVMLIQPHIESGSNKSDSDVATLLLRPDNTLDRILANGNVRVENGGPQPGNARADEAEIVLGPEHDLLQSATFTGHVVAEGAGDEPANGSADKLLIHFVGKNLVESARGEGNVHLKQRQKPQSPSGNPQDLELTAPAVDFAIAAGKHIKRAVTSGPPQIAIRDVANGPANQTLVTAEKFTADFDAQGSISSLHGAPNARIANSGPGQPDRVSTSNTLDVAFRAGKGIESIVQTGNLAYVDNERKAWADRGRYTPVDQMLVLTGSPRVVDQGMATTAVSMKMNRATGDAIADGDVRSTYSDLKAQPNGAMLASSSPIHVTSKSMTASRTAAVATYTGQARLWQDANIVQAPWIQFDRDRRSMVARNSPSQTVSTVIVQTDKSGTVTPIAITSSRLTYTDSDRKIYFEGGVVLKGSDSTMTANEAEVFLRPRSQTPGNKAPESQSQLDHIIARGQVVVTQPNRKAIGDQLVYTADEDKFVLTGGPPSIFDAERGKITGVSLTFFRTGDRVVVEGSDSSPTVTHTRVAH